MEHADDPYVIGEQVETHRFDPEAVLGLLMAARRLERISDPSLPRLWRLLTCFFTGRLLIEFFTGLSDEYRWWINPKDPMALLRHFPTLSVAPGYRLVSYLWGTEYESDDAHSQMWAIPDGPVVPPEECPLREYGTEVNGHRLTRPEPPGGIEEFMQVVQGDGSPWSYLSASLFAREAKELGASWHGLDWHTHTVLGLHSPPSGERPRASSVLSSDVEEARRALEKIMTGHADWKWYGAAPVPVDWGPVVEMAGDTVQVSFFTYSGLFRAALYLHRDTYRAGSYCFETTRQAVATGPGGYLF